MPHQQREDEEKLAARAHDAEQSEEEGSGEEAQLDPVEVGEGEDENFGDDDGHGEHGEDLHEPWGGRDVGEGETWGRE